jgi:transcription antitermination factor NusG
MLDVTNKNNLELVKSALHGITGIAQEPAIIPTWHYMVVSRFNREFDTVDSFRRHGRSASWPSFEQLIVTRQIKNDAPVRRIKRIGIVPGYVFTPMIDDCDFTEFLKRIVGAIDVVRSDSGNPLLLEDEDILTLKRIEISRNTPVASRECLKEAIKHDFKVGEKVRFIDDTRRRWPPGRIIALARQGRIVVEVSLMGRKVKVEALPHQIQRV